jgi:hypothetical protein
MVASKSSRTWKSAAARRLLALAGNPATIEEAIPIVANETIKDIPHPPLVLDSLSQRLNISAIELQDVPFSGELRPCNGTYMIVCSVHLSPSRRRFTIAHEMAHAIFERTGPNCPRSGVELERLCDMLATELLMPKSSFVKHAGPDPSIDKIFELAQTFQTSLMATAIRCAELLGISVFEIENHSVLWGHGVVKKGPVRRLEGHLQQLIPAVFECGRGEAIVHLSPGNFARPWVVQYRRIRQNRALFAMHPQRGHPSDRALPDLTA